MKRSEKESMKLVPAIEKSHLIFTELLNHPEGLTAAKLSTTLNVAISSMHRIISTLLCLGYIREAKPGTNYVLGMQFIPFAKRVVGNIDLKEIASPYMKKLCSTLGETVKLSVLEGNMITVINVQETNKPLHISITPQTQFPLHVGAASKVLLAFCGKDIGDSSLGLIEPYESFTSYTITTKQRLERDLEKIRLDSVGFDDQEYIEGVRAIAVPLFDAMNMVTGALSIPYFISTTNEKHYVHIETELSKTASAISRKLGSFLTDDDKEK